MKASLLHNIISAAAVLLCLSLLFASCSVSPEEEETTAVFYEPTSAAVPEGMITVPYTSLDTVNPFLCDSLLNSALVSLVYRSLYRLDGGFSPVKDIAVSESVSESTVRVDIDDGLVFSDASPLTAEDVAYSFRLAQKSPLWSESLDGIDSCTAESASSVSFKLTEPDVNILNVLTFPIAKAGTADTEEALPVGAGYYKYEKTDIRLSLTCNLRYAGELPTIGTVRLYDVTDSSSLMHLLDTGVIDCFFADLSDGTAKRTYSSVNEVYLNNLVFLGLNHEAYRLSLPDVRRAVSKALDRRALAENAFVSHARATWLPFNMSWIEITDSPYISVDTDDSDIRAADALLDSVGCGISGDRLYMTLICRDTNSFMKNAAAMIADELALVNIEVTVSLLSGSDFNKALQEGEYDMYLSEIKLTKNMDLSPFFTPGGKASYGINNEDENIDDLYFSYRSGGIETEEFLSAFYDSMPFVPLLYRNGQFCYSRGINGITEATENALFSSIADWQVK